MFHNDFSFFPFTVIFFTANIPARCGVVVVVVIAVVSVLIYCSPCCCVVFHATVVHTGCTGPPKTGTDE